MRLICWNVNGSRRVGAQAEALLSAAPDLIALQEVRKGTVGLWLDALRSAGFQEPGLRTTVDLVGDQTNFLLTASRWPIHSVYRSFEFDLPYRQLLLACSLDVAGHRLDFFNTHVPNGSGNGWRKVEHLEGLYRYLSRTSLPDVPRILCGDFNSPRRELPDGTVITWAQTESGTLGVNRGPRWDAAERSVILGLAAFDLHDVYRRRYKYERIDHSWFPRRRGAQGRRLDHVFASDALRVTDCGYLHEWREEGLSDHSSVWADFRWPTAQSPALST